MRRHAERACKLILNRAPVEPVTRQLNLALFMDAKLDLDATKHVRAKSTRQGALTRRRTASTWDPLDHTPT